MPIEPTVKNGQATANLAETNQALREALAQANRKIAELTDLSEYYRRVILAMSRKALSAEKLAERLEESDPNVKHYTFDEVLAELKKMDQP